jgi:methyltransferase family protein
MTRQERDITRYITEMKSVPGWLEGIDCWLLYFAAKFQQANSTEGDILEIGVYRGRSAILLGFLLNANQRLVANDVFSQQDRLSHDNRIDNHRWYKSNKEDEFLLNYARFHTDPPIVAAGPSADLATMTGRSYRLIHVDGAHDFDTVRQDIKMALQLLAPNGMVVLDDICKPHVMDVAAATWEAVSKGDLIPVLFTDQKLYSVAYDGPADDYQAFMVESALELPHTRVDYHHLFGRDIPRVVPRPAPNADWYSEI